MKHLNSIYDEISFIRPPSIHSLFRLCRGFAGQARALRASGLGIFFRDHFSPLVLSEIPLGILYRSMSILVLILNITDLAISKLHASPLYNIQEPYEKFLKEGPCLPNPMPQRVCVKKSCLSLFGHPLNSPIGVAACSLVTDKGIPALAQLGYDVITHKTICCCARPINSGRIYAVDVDHHLECFEIGATFHVQEQSLKNICALTNSFGNCCPEPDQVVADIAAARAALLDGQVLIVSVYGEGETELELIQQFVSTACLAAHGGAHVIEANLSCPNVGAEGSTMYQDVHLVQEICSAITSALPEIPLSIKIGVCESREQLQDIIMAAYAGGARGICGINTIPVRVVDTAENPVYGPRHEVSGLSGAPLKNLALQFTRDARSIIDEHKLDMMLFATGGITQPEDFDQFLAAGANIVLCATGAMLNATLALDYHRRHAPMCDEQKKSLIIALNDIGAVRLQNTKFRSGIISPLYIDLRTVISYPALLKSLAQSTQKLISSCTFDKLCAVPYAALPVTVATGLLGDYSMIMQRKEAKDHGTQKMIEGVFKKGEVCVVIEDVISTGGSILETIKILEREGLIVFDAIALVNWELGGMENVQKRGYTVHALYTISEIISVLLDEGIITHQQFAAIKQLCAEHTIKT
jgi:orotate phosphoribosyltransferase